MADTIFPKGVRVFEPHPKAPSFIKGSIVITVNEFVTFCKENQELLSEYKGQKQIKLQLQERKGGGLSITVDTYKAKASEGSDLPF